MCVCVCVCVCERERERERERKRDDHIKKSVFFYNKTQKLIKLTLVWLARTRFDHLNQKYWT